MNAICKPKFSLGQVVATPGALEALEESGQTPQFFLEKHQQGDWGEICEEDKMLNDQALVDVQHIGQRFRSADDQGHRIATTLLRPDEY